jgi:acetyl-CoA C-acetyltransferase
MKEVVIIDGVRTPIGLHGGAFKTLTAQSMLADTIKALLERVPQFDPKLIDDVIIGCIVQGSDAPNIGHVAALMAGMPVNVPGYTIQRNCVSGMMAISSACQAIQAGDGEIFLVGGVENMSAAPYTVRGARWGLKLRSTEFIDTLWEGLTDPVCGDIMGKTAENVAMMYGLTRDQLDRFAIDSHKKAFRAQRMNKFANEIIPIRVTKRIAGEEVAYEDIVTDEGINPGLSLQKAALYPTFFKKDGVVTPANSCPISDGAAALLVMTAEKAQELGLKPRAAIRGYAYAAIPPDIMGMGPAYAIPKVLKRAGMALTDVDLVEVNEAFAAQVIACGMELEDQGWDWDKLNVHGGAIALGHPVGCTGSRFVVTLLNALEDRGLSIGLATACVGGGMGGAIVIEKN